MPLKFNFFLLTLFLPLCLKADCPLVQPVIDTGDNTALLNLLDPLKACNAKEDSIALVYYSISINYYYEDNYDAAIDYMQKASKIYESLYLNAPTEQLGKSLHNLGAFYGWNGQMNLAKVPLKKAIDIFEKLENPRAIRSFLELGNVYNVEGEFSAAKNYYNLGISRARTFDDPENAAKLLYSLGEVYIGFGDYPNALKVCKASMEILDTLSEPEYEDIVKCNINLGAVSYELGNYKDAIAYFKESMDLLKALGAEDESISIIGNLGLAYLKDGQKTKAFEVFQEGIEKARKKGYPRFLAQNYDNLGEFHITTEMYDHASAAFQNAIKTLIPQFKSNNFLDNPSKDDIVNVSNKIDLLIYFSDKARALFLNYKKTKEQKYLSKAIELYALGDGLIDQLRQEHSATDTKLFWREEVVPFYENAIEVCHELKNVEQAFFFFEKSRAILLLEALQDSDAMQVIPDSLRTVAKSLKRKLISSRENLEDAGGADRSQKLEALVEAQKRFDKHNQYLTGLYPEYFEVKNGTSTIAFKAYQDQVQTQSGKSSVHYFYGKEQVYALGIDKDGRRLLKLGSTSQIEKEIRNFLTYFEKSSVIENDPQGYLAIAHHLYQRLIEPLGFEKSDLIIYPDGALAFLPFEALIEKPDTELSKASYLMYSHVIRYGYSATILAQQQKNKTDTRNLSGVFAFAPFSDPNENSKLPVLAFSADELKQIEEITQGEFKKASKASKQAFLKEMDQYTVLHLSTHAFSSPTLNKPHIVFSDTLLYLSELYSMDIPAKLVVLSACQSNIGRFSGGEGVMSLGRGFTYAGTESLVASLWNVNANANGRILSDFYKNLNEGQTKYQALHQAKKSYLENKEIANYELTPYYWAGMVYYGDATTIDLKSGAGILKKILYALILLLIVGGGYLVGKRYS